MQIALYIEYIVRTKLATSIWSNLRMQLWKDIRIFCANYFKKKFNNEQNWNLFYTNMHEKS